MIGDPHEQHRIARAGGFRGWARAAVVALALLAVGTTLGVLRCRDGDGRVAGNGAADGAQRHTHDHRREAPAPSPAPQRAASEREHDRRASAPWPTTGAGRARDTPRDVPQSTAERTFAGRLRGAVQAAGLEQPVAFECGDGGCVGKIEVPNDGHAASHATDITRRVELAYAADTRGTTETPRYKAWHAVEQRLGSRNRVLLFYVQDLSVDEHGADDRAPFEAPSELGRAVARVHDEEGTDSAR